MKGMFPLGALLVAASVIPIEPAQCKQTHRGETRSANWETDGNGHLNISLDARATGEVSLRCRIRLPLRTASAILRVDRALVSFGVSVSKGVGSGLVLSIGSASGELLRVSGEDWIEASHREWRTGVPPESRFVTVELRVTDNSALDPLRVDLLGVSVIAEESYTGKQI